MGDAQIARMTSRLRQVDAVQSTKARQVEAKKADGKGADFSTLLERTLARQQSLHFSKHVQARLQQREVELGPDDMARLDAALDLARQKGIRDSLILTRDAAFIVNVPNKVVVTAMQRQAAAFRVFTNIDGVIISE